VYDIEDELAAGFIRPDVAKRKMGRSVVALYHGSEAAEAAEDQFDLVHRRHEIPRTVREVQLPPGLAGERTIWLPRLLTELGLASSHSDARRQIEQGGVRIDGEPVLEAALEVPRGKLVGRVVQVGRRKFVKIAG